MPASHARKNDVSGFRRPVVSPSLAAPSEPISSRALDCLAGARLFGGLHELVPARAVDGPTAFGFALDAARACADLKPQGGLVLVLEEFVGLEAGVPYGPGLLAAGLDVARLILIRTRNPRETLLATETALRSPATASVIVASAMSPRLYDLTASRRLLLAAQAGGAAAILLPLAFAGHAASMSSAATVRVEIARRRGCALPFGVSLPLPGRPAFAFRVLKAPGALAARDREQWVEDVLGATPTGAEREQPAGFAHQSRSPTSGPVTFHDFGRLRPTSP